MTIWIPEIEGRDAPRYLAIADTIGEAVGGGELSVGDRLPTHRDLAHRLGVTVGTVSRAYAEAERRGLIAGEVGRGTYVRDRITGGADANFAIPKHTDPALIDMSLNVPVWNMNAPIVAGYLSDLSKDRNLAGLLRYQPEGGLPGHRQAGARWLGDISLDIPPERVLVTCGTQHSLMTTLMTIANPGDLILAESLSYPALKVLANHLHLRLQGLRMDGEGLLPEAFEDACKKLSPKALYCIPTQHNPTTATMSEGRRRAIAEIAERHGVFIIEDDVYGFLPEDRPPPIAAFAPDITFLATGVSKYMLGGLRSGFLAVPEQFVRPTGISIRASMWFTPPLNAEIVSRFISDGAFGETLSWLRRELKIRHDMVRRALSGHCFHAQDTSFHVWIIPPEPWRGEELVAELKRRSVVVVSSETFAVDREPPQHAIRLCLCGETDRDKIERGLGIVADTLSRPPSPSLSAI